MADHNCCFIDAEKGECVSGEDLFVVYYSKDPEDYTEVCRAHIGELIDVGRDGSGWVSSTVYPLERTA